MKFKEHCEESVKLFGESFDYVHQWLDHFAHYPSSDGTGRWKFNPYHRKHRHHLAGAQEVKEKWGDKAYEAAIQHIRSDLVLGEGLKENEPLPNDENDYIKRGFF